MFTDEGLETNFHTVNDFVQGGGFRPEQWDQR